MHTLGTTFEEHVQILEVEAPHALILEWGRRLELAVKNYGEVLGVRKGHWKHYLKAVLEDTLIDQETSTAVFELRRKRNKIAHEAPQPISPDDAPQYARKAQDIIWRLGRAQDRREKREGLFS